ncbi:MAG: Stp1/IreP family PP2C-type Ser/Thr phosphatase [Oscillospiraceae bacterium]
MKLAGKTNIGLQRAQNQDDFLIKQLEDDVCFLLVCDGMGGAKAGSVASKRAKDDIFSYIDSYYKSSGDIEEMLIKSIEFANRNIFVNSNENEEHSGMGTTAVMAFLKGEKLTIAHVGDSRAYLINKDKIKPLTVDHSVVQTLLDEGKISIEEAKNHPQKNIITRAIGVCAYVDVDVLTMDMEENDVLILCTDGLNGIVEDNKIYEIVKHNHFYECTQHLIDIANSEGGCDNITVVMATLD